MQKINGSITFTCPGCKETFEFDPVDEYQLVSCPICGINFITIRKGGTLLLESFEFEANEKCRLVDLSEVTMVES
jgi:Zn finger protein HypA/HybF involved in hydrogenase expression